MKILRGISTDKTQPLTAPFPVNGHVFLEFRGGDILHPLGAGDWFRPPYFARVFRAFCAWRILPFLSWRFGSVGGYIGAKVYGADSDAYCNWMNSSDVFPGSLALMFSVRFKATL